MSLLQHVTQSLLTLDCYFPSQHRPLPVLLTQYLQLIEKWNRIYNLTAIRNPEDMLYQHVMDSLAVIPYINGPQIIDVGSGAGLPGIPLALVRPDWQVLLIESNHKKASFLQQVKIELALQNIRILARRVEEVRSDIQVNTVITRAFSELGNFIFLTRKLAVENNTTCRWAAMKADCSAEELEQVSDPFIIEKIVALAVPGLNVQRQLIIIKKMPTPG